MENKNRKVENSKGLCVSKCGLRLNTKEEKEIIKNKMVESKPAYKREKEREKKTFKDSTSRFNQGIENPSVNIDDE